MRPKFPYALPLKYSGPDLTIIHTHALGDDIKLHVIGDPDNGSYEWCIEYPDKLEYSDRGYGIWDIALANGICYYHGSDTVATGFDHMKTRTQLRAYQPRYAHQPTGKQP